MNRGRRNSGRIPAVEDAQLAKTVAQSFLILTTVHPSASAWLSACSAPTRVSNSRSASSCRRRSRSVGRLG